MKSSSFLAGVVCLALAVAATPACLADSTQQNGTSGAQGTEGTNPTHQDQSTSGPGQSASGSSSDKTGSMCTNCPPH